MHDEAGVDGDLPVGGVDQVGVGVSAEPVVGLEQRHPGGPGGHVGRGQAGDAGPDHGDVPVAAAHVASEKSKSAIGSLVG